jgi:hypothetical protein
MKNVSTKRPSRAGRPTRTTDDRQAALAAFELWQRQWPALFHGAAWLHLERLKESIAQPRPSPARKATSG